MNALLSKGDQIVVTFPGYQSLYQVAIEKNCQVDFWEPDNKHVFHIEDLLKLISSTEIHSHPMLMTNVVPAFSLEIHLINRVLHHHQKRMMCESLVVAVEKDCHQVLEYKRVGHG